MARLDLLVDVDVRGDKLRGLGSTLGDVAKIAAGTTAAIGAVGVFTAGFASDMNESLSKVGVVFGENADDIRQWSKDAAKSLGVSQQVALESAGTFGNLFTAMEIGQEPAADMSKELVQLASDLASFNNIDPTEALEKLRAGIVGEAEPLRTLGVNISAAATEQKALELGLVSVGEELTAADKAMANYALIMEQTSTAQGDFARTSDGMANQQRTLAATFQDTMAQLGQAFVPIFEAILPQLTAGLQAFSGWVTSNGPAIGDVLKNVASGIGQAFTFVIDVVIPALVTGFQWFSTNILPGLVAAFQAVAEWVTANWPKISEVIGQAMGAIQNVLKVVMPILIQIAKVLFPAIGRAASDLFGVLSVVFGFIGEVFEDLGNTFMTGIDNVTRLWRNLVRFFTDTVRTFERIGDAIFKPIGEGFGAAIGFIKGIWNAFARWWNSIEISVPSVDIPFVGKVGGFSVGLPDLPMLASGGIVTDPTLALIGESGPEAVIPLSQMPSSQVVIEVNVLGDLKAEDEQDVADAIARVLWTQGMTDRVLVEAG